jgi:hypothetical protein
VARDVARFEGGPLHGESQRINQILVRIMVPEHDGSYVFTGIDNYYGNVKHYRWEPDD